MTEIDFNFVFISKVEKLWLLEVEWDVKSSTLNRFLSNMEVDELEMWAFPTDYHERFPKFQVR